ncbi:MAG: glycoside hydrolase family 31 protein [Clostridia bacterium]|nr:glycoside hydrolase family 31 protein [Clostridia bacterium]
MAIRETENGILTYQNGREKIRIEPWGKDSLRIRVSYNSAVDTEKDWALLPKPEGIVPEMAEGEDGSVSIRNGKIQAVIDRHGYIFFYNQDGKELTREYWRNRRDLTQYSVPLNYNARQFKPILGGAWKVTAYFEAYDDEHLYGLGQYQEKQLDRKGLTLDLSQRNSQASIPFMTSTRGYGFLWNNPAMGRVTLGYNRTEWVADVTDQLDYWITAGDTPAQIQENYTAVTGRVPMLRDDVMGFWQCKLRYRTQEELLSVAREYHRRGIPLDVIVIDFFHWTKQGDWKFDPVCWPDPDAMIRELNDMGIKLMVSIWPTVDVASENNAALKEMGGLLEGDHGSLYSTFMGYTTYFDSTHPGARKLVWSAAKKNYFDRGIDLFWLDEAEPETASNDMENVRFNLGPGAQVANIYPIYYSKAFYDGMTEAGMDKVVNLVRCAWAGSQRFGTLLWSGDVYSSWRTLREQLCAGLSASVSGIPWWTCDIGGFIGGYTEDPAFRELLVRWFEMGAFLPIFRLHGERLPHWPHPGMSYKDEKGNPQFGTGSGNEIWSFGEDNYEILKKYILLREQLRPYIKKTMGQAHETGMLVIRPLFFAYPEDPQSIAHEDTYMFGDDILVSPVFQAGTVEKKVYLPEGETWREVATGKVYAGGQVVDAKATLDVIPLFVRQGAEVNI